MPDSPRNQLSGRQKVASVGSEHVQKKRTVTHIIYLGLDRRSLFFTSNNDFRVQLSGNYLLVGSSELMAISSTRKMWNDEGNEVEGTLNGPDSLSSIGNSARIMKQMDGNPADVWKRLIADAPRLL